MIAILRRLLEKQHLTVRVLVLWCFSCQRSCSACWCMYQGCSTDAMDGAAENGSLGVVKWLHQNRDEGCTGDAIFLAAKVRKRCSWGCF